MLPAFFTLTWLSWLPRTEHNYSYTLQNHPISHHILLGCSRSVLYQAALVYGIEIPYACTDSEKQKLGLRNSDERRYNTQCVSLLRSTARKEWVRWSTAPFTIALAGACNGSVYG